MPSEAIEIRPVQGGPRVVIVGGGAIGAAVACHLMMDARFRDALGGEVTVLERDPRYTLAASALSAASIRQQFTSAVNVRISLHGVAFLRGIGAHLSTPDATPAVGLHEGGYLYLGDEGSAPALLAANRLQRGLGADIAHLGREALAARFPWLALDDIAAGNLGLSGEGWFDGWGLLQAFRAKAKALGARFVQAEAVGYAVTADRVTAVRLADGSSLACDWAVNAAGSQGARLAATAGVDLPVAPKTRHVFSFLCKGDVPNSPLVIDTSGVWWRPEGARGPDGQRFICGLSPPPERDPDWPIDGAEAPPPDWVFFESEIWPALAARAPAFEAIRTQGGWTGPYDMNLLDANAILGPAVGLPNLLLANGFSGHGLQQAPAVGRGLAEWITHGRYLSLDLADLGHRRIVEKRPLAETNVI
jgi:glycine/D-amino acid oxidase-like deaminating enzyme